jgi:hypothetical protein
MGLYTADPGNDVNDHQTGESSEFPEGVRRDGPPDKRMVAWRGKDRRRPRLPRLIDRHGEGTTPPDPSRSDTQRPDGESPGIDRSAGIQFGSGNVQVNHFHGKGTSDERKVRARKERADAFTELWMIAQNANIGVRNDFNRVDELLDFHRKLNALLIEKAPALEPADVDLARSFLRALENFIRLLRPEPGQAADRVRAEIHATMDQPYFPADLDSLAAAYSEVSGYNRLLTIRYRKVVFGESEQDVDFR